MSDARAKLYINTGVVTDKTDIYNILRPLLKQTVSYAYYRGSQAESSGTGWVERVVVDHPEIASYFTPLSICVNLDSPGVNPNTAVAGNILGLSPVACPSATT